MQRSREAASIGEALIAGGVATAIYLLTLARNLGAAHDSIDYMLKIDQQLTWFHPHHLLYHWLAVGWMDFWRGILPGVDHVLLVESINAVAGGVIVGIFYLVLRRRVRLDIPSSVAGTMLPAFSFGLWFYSTAVEVYVIPIAFLMVALYLLSAETLTLRTFVLAGVAHGVALLFHQAYLLFIIAVAAAALLHDRLRRPTAWRSLALYSAAGGTIAILPYLWVAFGVLKLRSADELLGWLTMYAHQSEYWNPPGVSTVIRPAIGFGRSIIGGHFIMGGSAFQGLITRLLPDKWLSDEAFLVRALSTEMTWGLAAAALIIVSMVAWLLVRYGRHATTALRRHRSLVIVAAGWLGAFTAFFIFWDPSNVEFWIPQSLCVWLLLIVLWSRPEEADGVGSRLPVVPVGTVALLLLLTNYLGSIQWMTSRGNDYYYMRIEPVAEGARANDLVVIGRSWLVNYYLERFSPAPFMALAPMNQDVRDYRQVVSGIHDSIAVTRDRGGSVYISEDAVHPEPQTLHWIRERMGGEGFDAEAIWDPYRSEWTSISNGVGTYYRIEPRTGSESSAR